MKGIFVNTFLQVEAEAAEFRRAEQGHKTDLKVMSVCVIVAFSLTMIAYLGNYNFVVESLKGFGFTDASGHLESVIAQSSNARLARLAWWATVTVLFYLVVPALFIRIAWREPLANYGLKVNGALKDYHLYFILFLVMVPLVMIVSGSSSFQARYPFYKLENGESLFPYFWSWQALYFLQFFALEFFFRGFMLHGIKKRFGYYSVFAMCIPYCMIHFSKPMPEALSAIIAGIVLGTLSLKSGSIMLGVLIHYSVAITMDLAALWRKDLLW